MIFDRTKAIAIINSYRDGMVSGELLFWLQACGLSWNQIVTNPHANREVCQGYSVSVALALSSPAEHFIFADADMRPRFSDNGEILTSDADIVGTTYPLPSGHGFDTPNAFHCGLWRTTRAALVRVPRPLFRWGYTEDGCQITACPCAHFASQARSAGLVVAQAGRADHGPRS